MSNPHFLPLMQHDPSNSLELPGIADLTHSSIFLQDTTRKFAVIFHPLTAEPIARLALHFEDYAVGTPPTYRISLQGVTAAGIPDGTIKADGAAYADLTPSGTANDWRLVWVTLGASYTPTPGERLAIVIAHQSGTVDGSNHSRIAYRWNAHPTDNPTSYPTWYTGAWGRDTYGHAQFGYGDTDTKNGTLYDNVSYTLFSSGSVPDTHALKFRIPSSLCARFSLAGAIAHMAPPWPGKSFDLILYDSDFSTALATRTFYTEQFNKGCAYGASTLLFNEATPAILFPDTDYLIAVVPLQADTNIQLGMLSLTDSDALNGIQFNAPWHLVSRTDTGSWVNTTTQRPLITPLAHTLYPTYPPPDADAIPAFPIVMFSAADAKTPLEGLTVTAETMIDGADFTACTNAPTEKSDGVYLLDIAGADQGDHTTLLKFTAPGALTQYASLVR